MKIKTSLILIVILLIIAGVIYGGIYYLRGKRAKLAQQLLTEARELMEKNDPAAAEARLKTIISNYARLSPGEEACSLLIELAFKQQKWDEVKTYSQLLQKNYPQSKYIAQVLYYEGETVLNKGQLQEARQIFEQIMERYPKSAAIPQAQFGLAKADFKDHRLKKAKTQLDQLRETYKDSPIKGNIEDLLGQVNIKLLFSPEPGENDVIYEIKPGDTIYELARQYKVTQDLLMRCNGIRDPRALSIGKKIKIPKTDFSIVIDKSNNTLSLYSGDKFFKSYRVRTGKYDYQTPRGDYEIENKKKDPAWVNPRTHKRYPPGDPENELGSRWMSFYRDKLGIHGTIHPETIGQYASYGCVGMLEKEVEELYDIISIGTPVKIIGETSFKEEQ